MQVIYSHFFPSILQSEYHIFGWHNVNKIGKLIKSKLVNIKTLTSAAIMQAHCFQCLIYLKKERQLFYEYIGHSEDINECRYQAPATVMELTNIGRQLVNMDSKILLLFFFQFKKTMKYSSITAQLGTLFNAYCKSKRGNYSKYNQNLYDQYPSQRKSQQRKSIPYSVVSSLNRRKIIQNISCCLSFSTKIISI